MILSPALFQKTKVNCQWPQLQATMTNKTQPILILLRINFEILEQENYCWMMMSMAGLRWEAFIIQKMTVEMPEELLTNIMLAQELRPTISPACMDSW